MVSGRPLMSQTINEFDTGGGGGGAGKLGLSIHVMFESVIGTDALFTLSENEREKRCCLKI